MLQGGYRCALESASTELRYENPQFVHHPTWAAIPTLLEIGLILNFREINNNLIAFPVH